MDIKTKNKTLAIAFILIVVPPMKPPVAYKTRQGQLIPMALRRMEL